MEVELVETLAKLRLLIGYLGEREQFAWWQSSFFTQGSQSFLLPLFGRTQVLAQCNGVSQAAALVHDERIGAGNVYHLFRLPEDMEQTIHRVLHDIKPAQLFTDKETALKFLQKNFALQNQTGLGPTRIGGKNDLLNKNTWKLAAALYYEAFQKNIQIFPYLADIS